jgi:hypothetical protein
MCLLPGILGKHFAAQPWPRTGEDASRKFNTDLQPALTGVGSEKLSRDV